MLCFKGCKPGFGVFGCGEVVTLSGGEDPGTHWSMGSVPERCPVAAVQGDPGDPLVLWLPGTCPAGSWYPRGSHCFLLEGGGDPGGEERGVIVPCWGEWLSSLMQRVELRPSY